MGRYRDWELLWAPYDEPTYQDVMEHIRPDDVVLEIGAGDQRLANRLAERARRVYAIEINQGLKKIAPKIKRPDNVQVIWADAILYPFPREITIGVLLMRHCRHFGNYADKLRKVGCQRLVTNARWGVGVEVVDLQASRSPYAALTMGWYACWCGETGFVPGPAERLTPELDTTVVEVVGCPLCRQKEQWTYAGVPEAAQYRN